MNCDKQTELSTKQANDYDLNLTTTESTEDSTVAKQLCFPSGLLKNSSVEHPACNSLDVSVDKEEDTPFVTCPTECDEPSTDYPGKPGLVIDYDQHASQNKVNYHQQVYSVYKPFSTSPYLITCQQTGVVRTKEDPLEKMIEIGPETNTGLNPVAEKYSQEESTHATSCKQSSTDTNTPPPCFQARSLKTINYNCKSIITLGEFKEIQSKTLEQDKQIVKHLFLNRAEGMLKEIGISEDRCKIWAERIVINGDKLKIKAVPGYPLSLADVYKMYNDWSSILSYQCILISLPNKYYDDQDGRWVSHRTDAKETQEEMKNFVLQMFPITHFDEARLEEMIIQREVNTQQQLRTYLSEFFTQQEGIRAKRALHAWIVIFGHGSTEGLTFYKDEDMPLDEINLYVKQVWREALWSHPEELPARVEIIYSQCHGHRYDQTAIECDRFKVISMATASNPVSTCGRNAQDELFNEDLADYAAEHVQQVVEFDNRRIGSNSESATCPPHQESLSHDSTAVNYLSS